jgi:antitoxin component of RelBE/YafQ-DinJ toxin-antitoxin module
MIMARTGRPTVDHPKLFEVKARIDEQDFNKLKDFCKQHNYTKSEVIRMAIKKVLEIK